MDLIFVQPSSIIKTFGKPKIVYTDYECGFYSGLYYQLVYSNFNYIGNDKEDFCLEHVRFEPLCIITIKYIEKELSGPTTKEEISKIIGGTFENIFEKPDDDSELIFFKGGDDGIVFTFKNGKLLTFEYSSPC